MNHDRERALAGRFAQSAAAATGARLLVTDQGSEARGLNAGDISLFSCCGLLVVVACVLAVASPDPGHLQAMFTPEHIRLLDMFDSRGQQWAHRILVIVLLAFGLGLWFLRPLQRPWVAPATLQRSARWVRENGGLLVLAWVLGSLVLHLRSYPDLDYYIVQGRLYALAMIPSPRTLLNLMALSSVAVLVVITACRAVAAAPHLRRAEICATVVVIAYAAALCLVGTGLRPDFTGFTAEEIAAVEWHYSGSVASADRLALGARLGEVMIQYGVLPSVLLAKWQQGGGILDLGGHIRVIALLQSCLMFVAVAAFLIWYRGRWVLAALAVLVTIPWVQPLHAAVLYPNQSAWRFLGLAVGILVLVIFHARPVRRLAWILGLTGGAALLWNTESGACLSAGYIAFLVIRGEPDAGRYPVAGLALRFVIGLAASLAVFGLLVRAGFGYWPDVIATMNAFPLISGFAQGYAGLELKRIDPWAALIFAHALYVLVRTLAHWGTGGLVASRCACRFAIAVVIVLWAAYYFKGPHFWNLWSFVFLYGFMIESLTSLPRTGPGETSFVALLRSPGLMALTLIVIPAAVTSNVVVVRSLPASVDAVSHRPECPGGEMLSGVCLPRDMARALREKAAALRDRYASGEVLYFSANSYLMPLMTGIYQRLSTRDAFTESIRRQDFDRLLEEVRTIRPVRLLFDAPGTLLRGSEFHRSFYGRVRGAVSSLYVYDGIADGWEVWRRKEPDGRNGNPGKATRPHE